MSHFRLHLFGILLAIPALLLSIIAIYTPITASGVLYLLGYYLITIGLIIAPQRAKYYRVLVSGLSVMVLVAGFRISHTNDNTSGIQIIELPSGKKSYWLNFFIDEQDSVLFGESLLRFIGVVTAREHENIVPALFTAYTKVRATQPVFPSPVIRTYLGFQKPTAFDAIVIEPSVKLPSPVAVVFLHGSMGNVSIQCWQIAQAVSNIGAVTLCPSTNSIGDWERPDSEAIVQSTLNYIHQRGIQKLYLGGYSNGGIGIGRLISTLSTEQTLKGLFFISGISNTAKIRETQLPVLVIQGTLDQKISVEKTRLAMNTIGNSATYVELAADHFLIMKQPQLVQEAINSWLKKCEAE